MAHHRRYAMRVEIDRDQSARCGCRRVLVGTEWVTVVWCPDHVRGECPGPWRRTRIDPRGYDDRDYDDFGPQADGYVEENDFDRELQECGRVPAAGGGCLMAGTEYCDFDCPFRDDDWDEED